jgi:pimeloyl-ACP methyl ester carboxylesterase
MGAGALCRLLADNPARFDRMVIFLPAALDTPRAEPARQRLAALLEAVQDGDAAAVAEAITPEVPPPLRDTPTGWGYYRTRLEQLMRDGLGAGLADLPDQAPLTDAALLSAVRTPTLVIGCRGDDLHPVEVAQRLATVLPNATLHVYPQARPLWTERADVRDRIAGFLAGET